MPRSPEQQEQIRRQRRAAILEAATALFVEHGFEATGVSTIARAAGVSHGTVFVYFPSKEDLFRAALLEPLTAFEEAFRKRVSEASGTPLERLAAIARGDIQHAARQERYLRLVHYVLGQRARFPDLMDRLTTYAETVSRLLMPIIEEGQQLGQLAPGDPQQIAWSYFAYVQGVALVYLAPPEDRTLWEEAARQAVRLFGPVRQPLPAKEG